MRPTKRDSRPWSIVCLAKLFMFLREYIRLGYKCHVKMERCVGNNERENCIGNTERCINMYEIGQVFFYEFCRTRQNLFDVVSCMAECVVGSTDESARNVAVGRLT